VDGRGEAIQRDLIAAGHPATVHAGCHVQKPRIDEIVDNPAGLLLGEASFFRNRSDPWIASTLVVGPVGQRK